MCLARLDILDHGLIWREFLLSAYVLNEQEKQTECGDCNDLHGSPYENRLLNVWPLSASWRDATDLNHLSSPPISNSIFGGSVMNSTIPADLLELKTRFETWRANRKYVREPISDELWNAAADLSRRYPPSLVGQVLKLDSSKLKKFLFKRSPRASVRKQPQANRAPV
jgi:hypothetical protein